MQIGPIQFRATANKSPGLVHAHAQGAAAIEHIAHTSPDFAVPRPQGVVQGRYFGLEKIRHAQVVLQALAYVGQVVNYCHAFVFQGLGVANARELQELGRIDRAARQNHLFAAFKNLGVSAYRALHTHGFAVFENHFAHQRVRDDLQVAAAHGGAQERVGCRLPQAIANGHLPQTKAFFALAIEIWGVSVT